LQAVRLVKPSARATEKEKVLRRFMIRSLKERDL
jgi:hypothetical protein